MDSTYALEENNSKHSKSTEIKNPRENTLSREVRDKDEEQLSDEEGEGKK